MYFDQLLGAARTQKLVEILFQPFSTFFVHFKPFHYLNMSCSFKVFVGELTKEVITLSCKGTNTECRTNGTSTVRVLTWPVPFVGHNVE